MIKICLLILGCLCLSGCFVPDKYYAVLTLTDKNYYFNFIGEMHMMALYTPEGQDAAVDKKQAEQQILSEFSRVIKERKPAKFELQPLENALFRTKFEYTSPYAHPEATGLFHFHVEENVLTVTSRHMSEAEKALIHKNDLPSKGTLCIKTYGKILESNAHKPANILQQCSIWNLENLDHGVKMVIRFSKSLDAP